MQRIVLILLAAVLFTACSNGRPKKASFQSTVCNRPVLGFTMTAIHYGDSRVIVLPVSKVRANTEFRVRLVPKHRSKTDQIDYNTIDVAVTGKSAQSSWINGSGDFNSSSHGMIVVGCVPQAATVGTSYEYKVEVPGVGIIDPRAGVVN